MLMSDEFDFEILVQDLIEFDYSHHVVEEEYDLAKKNIITACLEHNSVDLIYDKNN